MAKNNPHFSFPFRMNPAGTGAIVTEQDTIEEVEDCLEVLLSTEAGERLDLPRYGIEDIAFRENGIDIAYIRSVIAQWEPRAQIEITSAGVSDDLQQKIQAILLGGQRGG